MRLAQRYQLQRTDFKRGIAESEQNLATLIGQLTGDEFAIKGLESLIKQQ